MEMKTSLKNWYVAYTFPNAEKAILKNLERMQIISYLPMRETIRQWKDRRKKISSPLFPNYIFIYSTHKERYEALGIRGIVNYVSFDGKPAIISDQQIESLKKIVNGDVEVHRTLDLNPGKPVLITDGPFAGVEGIVERANGVTRLVVVLHCLGRAVSVCLSRNMVTSMLEHGSR
jgi:transcription antitermination factor NusG